MEEGKEEERQSEALAEFDEENKMEEGGAPSPPTAELPSPTRPEIPPTRQQSRGPPPQQQEQSRGPPQKRTTDPPPQQRQSQQKQPPPPGVQKPEKREKNDKFQDVDKTGQWGQISKREMIIGAGVLVLLLGGIVALIMVFVVNNDDAPKAPPPPSASPPSMAPSMRPEVDPAVQLPAILEAVESNVYTNASLSLLLSDDVSFYTTDLIEDTAQPPSVRALSWILNEDPRDYPPSSPWLVLRFALASVYYALGGEQWTNQDGWLTDAHACKWHGVYCDRSDTKFIYEIDLTQNNLAGSIPVEVGLLSDIRSLVLTSNQLTGSLPAATLGNMPSLSILFVNNNKLSGDLFELGPLIDNGVLSTMILHENNITGRWPRNFCPRASQPPVFISFTLDCHSDTRCLCCTLNNCY